MENGRWFKSRILDCRLAKGNFNLTLNSFSLFSISYYRLWCYPQKGLGILRVLHPLRATEQAQWLMGPIQANPKDSRQNSGGRLQKE